MWKVQTTRNDDLVVLLVSGRIERKHLAELRAVFESHAGKVALDMKEVKLVDQEAIEFLSRCESGGAELRNCPAYIREWIERGRGLS